MCLHDKATVMSCGMMRRPAPGQRPAAVRLQRTARLQVPHCHREGGAGGGHAGARLCLLELAGQQATGCSNAVGTAQHAADAVGAV